jgi:hypothetical protein
MLRMALYPLCRAATKEGRSRRIDRKRPCLAWSRGCADMTESISGVPVAAFRIARFVSAVLLVAVGFARGASSHSSPANVFAMTRIAMPGNSADAPSWLEYSGGIDGCDLRD